MRNRSDSNSEMKKYKQAVKQSQIKYKSHNPQPKMQKSNPKKVVHSKIKKNKRASHLRVIEGNKAKNKDHANL